MRVLAFFVFFVSGLVFAGNQSGSFSYSKYYKAIHQNDDQTITIEEPTFPNRWGIEQPESSMPWLTDIMYLSENSSLNGVCKLNGFGIYVKESFLRMKVSNEHTNVVIGPNSDVIKYENNKYVYAIRSIACRQLRQPIIPVSKNFHSKSTNNDGSTSIVRPRFKMNGENMYLSEKSDKKAVCRLYGFNSYITYARKNLDNYDLNVVLGYDCNFAKFEKNNDVYIIESITCN